MKRRLLSRREQPYDIALLEHHAPPPNRGLHLTDWALVEGRGNKLLVGDLPWWLRLRWRFECRVHRSHCWHVADHRDRCWECCSCPATAVGDPPSGCIECLVARSY